MKVNIKQTIEKIVKTISFIKLNGQINIGRVKINRLKTI